jgi:hypothetical protein
LSFKIIYENCEPELANNTDLPYTAYLVKYEVDGKVAYDIVNSSKRVYIFDHYWDKYRNGFKGFKQTEGRRNPRLWGNETKQKQKKNRK